MAKCYQCHEREATHGLLCADCVDSNREKKTATRDYNTIINSTRATNVNYLTSDLRILFIFGAIISLLIFVAYLTGFFSPRKFPSLLNAQSGSPVTDYCLLKQRCLVVYLAPWCPACKASIGLIRATQHFAESNPKIGVQLIVGMDSNNKLQKFAEELGGSTFVDSSNRIQDSVSVGGVPSWFVLDKDRNILNRGSGLPAGIERQSEQFQLFLRDYLGLIGKDELSAQ